MFVSFLHRITGSRVRVAKILAARTALLALGVLAAGLLLAGASGPHAGLAPHSRLPLAAAIRVTPEATFVCPTRTPTPTATSTPQPTSTPTPARPPAGGPPTRIVAPAIHLDGPVVFADWKIVRLSTGEARQWLVPDKAAGFHQGSAFPGHPGNTVISGHHNMGSQVFRYLIDLEIGDEIILYAGETPYRYAVAQKELLLEKGASDEQRLANARWIAPTKDERLTLVTCWPYSGNSHRLIIVAFPLP